MKKHLLRFLICGLAAFSLNSQGQCTPAKPSTLTAEGVASLPAAGANVNELGFLGRQAIHFAASKGKSDTVMLLLGHCAQVTTRDPERNCEIHHIKALAAAGTSINSTDRLGKAAIHLAAIYNNIFSASPCGPAQLAGRRPRQVPGCSPDAASTCTWTRV